MNPDLKVDPHERLYVTDAELIRRMGVPEKVARQTLKEFDAKPQLGFPKKQKIWGDRRYYPAVLAYLERNAGPTMGVSNQRERHNVRSIKSA